MRLIDANALKALIDDGWGEGPFKNAFFEEIDDTPTIDPVRHGKWRMKMMENVINGETRKVRECSECGSAYFVYDSSDNTIDVAPNYCPECGAKMDGGEG